MTASSSVNKVRHPRGTYTAVYPLLLSLEWLHQEKKVTRWRCHPYNQESRHNVLKSVLRSVPGRMHFTLHVVRRTPHGASRFAQTMSAWLVKPRRSPSRHSMDAQANGHRTTVMHKLSTPPPPLPLQAS